MSNDTEQARILKRVRKMMNLANDSAASEGERDNALRMAHATLAKYNLDIAQALDDKVDANNHADEPRERKDKVFHGTMWTRTASQAIAHLFFCSYFYQRLGPNTDKANHTFIGRTSNVITAQEMSEYVVMSIHREAQAYMRSVCGNYSTYRAFAQAAGAKVVSRCYEIRKASEQQAATPTGSTPGTALVLASVYKTEQQANDNFISTALGIKLTVSNRREKHSWDYDARAAGAAYGSRVSLDRQIN